MVKVRISSEGEKWTVEIEADEGATVVQGNQAIEAAALYLTHQIEVSEKEAGIAQPQTFRCDTCGTQKASEEADCSWCGPKATNEAETIQS